MKSVRFASIKKLARELGVCPEGKLTSALLKEKCVESLGSEDLVLQRLGLKAANPKAVEGVVEDLPRSIRGRTLEFKPLVDLGRLAAVINNPTIYETGYTVDNGERLDGDAQLAVLKRLFIHVSRGKTTKYTQSTKVEGGYTGRYFARDPSVQGTWRVLRHTILRDYVHPDGRRIVDLDIENAHPVLLSQWCSAHGIDASCLQGYIDNKRKYRAEAMAYYIEHGLVPDGQSPKEFVKKEFLKLLNGGKMARGAEGLPLMREFAAGIDRIHAGVIKECSHWANHARRKYVGSKYSNVEGTTCNYLMSHLEQLIWCSIYDARQELGLDIVCNQFDGWLVLMAPDVDKGELCQRMMDVVKRDTGYVVSIEHKAFDEGYEVDPAHIPTDLKDLYINDVVDVTPSTPKPGFTPDITINERFVRSVNPADGVFLRSATGTGKTQWLVDWLKSQPLMPRCLYLCNRIRLTNSICARLNQCGIEGVVHYDNLPMKNMPRQHVIVTTLESLDKTAGLEFDYVIMDEFDSLLNQVTAPNFKSVNRFALTITRVLRTARVIAMDGLMTDESIDSFVDSFPNHKYSPRVLNTYANKTDETMTMVDSREYLVSLITKACDERKSFAIATDSRAFALTMSELLRERCKGWDRQPDQYVYVGGDRSDEDVRRLAWFEEPGKLSNVSHLIYTPSIESGVSIVRSGFDVQFNMFSHRDVSLISCLQMTNRVRSKFASYTYIEKPWTALTADGLAHAMRQRTCEYDYDQSVGSIALLDLETNGVPSMPVSKLYIAAEVRKGKQLSRARRQFINEAAVQGYRVLQHIVEDIDDPKLLKTEFGHAKYRKNINRDADALSAPFTVNGEPSLLNRFVHISGIGLRDAQSLHREIGPKLKPAALGQLCMRSMLSKPNWVQEACNAVLERSKLALGADVSNAVRREAMLGMAYGSDHVPDTVKLVAIRVLSLMLGQPAEMPKLPVRIGVDWVPEVHELVRSCDVGGMLSLCGYRGKLTEAAVLKDPKCCASFVTWLVRRVFGISSSKLRVKAGEDPGYHLCLEGLPFHWEVNCKKCGDEQMELYGSAEDEEARMMAEFYRYEPDANNVEVTEGIYEAFEFTYEWERGPKGVVVRYRPKVDEPSPCPPFLGPLDWERRCALGE